MRKVFLYIICGLALFCLLFYLIFFFTLSKDTVTGEINRVAGKAGYEFRAENVRKGLPLTITFEGVTLEGSGDTDILTFPEVVFSFKLSDFFGKFPIVLTVKDREDNALQAAISRNLDSMAFSAADFAFSPDKRKSLPSFFARKLDLTIERIQSDTVGNVLVAGMGTFLFDYLLFTGQYGLDVEITGLAGKAIFRGKSIYFKDCSATLLTSSFDFEGTISDYLRWPAGEIDIIARGRKVSPLLLSLLKIPPENEYNVNIRIRGTLASPNISVLNR